MTLSCATLEGERCDPQSAFLIGQRAREQDIMELNLSGRVAVVTGSSAGIGRAVATTLAREGAQVVLVARRADALQALADELESMGAPRPIPVPLDTTDASAA